MKYLAIKTCIIATVLCLSGCFSEESSIGTKAVATLVPLNGSSVSGVVNFEQLDGKVKVTARVSGLTPNGKHGFHVHQFGDLTKGNGKSAGGHYNPAGHPHGLPPEKHRHAGSFGNIKADANGKAMFYLEDDTISISDDFHPIIGRAVIIHVSEDTGAQPAGNAGKRIAGGVIGYRQITDQ